MSIRSNGYTGQLRISCDDCGLVVTATEGMRMEGKRILPPPTWTTVRVTSTDQYRGDTLAWHFCPRCTVVVELPVQEEPGFVDDVC